MQQAYHSKKSAKMHFLRAWMYFEPSQKKGGFAELMRLPLSKLLALAMTLTALSQFSGINGVIFYGPTKQCRNIRPIWICKISLILGKDETSS